ARLDRMSEVPIEEIIISLAGPAVNVVIFVGLMLVLMATGLGVNAPTEFHAPASISEFLWFVMILNIGLLVFNLIPAFPMDGGRVFRALLAFFLPRITATKLAVAVSMCFSVLFVLWAILARNPLPLLIAVFIPVAGLMELAMLQRQAEAERKRRFAE